MQTYKCGCDVDISDPVCPTHGEPMAPSIREGWASIDAFTGEAIWFGFFPHKPQPAYAPNIYDKLVRVRLVEVVEP